MSDRKESFFSKITWLIIGAVLSGGISYFYIGLRIAEPELYYTFHSPNTFRSDQQDRAFGMIEFGNSGKGAAKDWVVEISFSSDIEILEAVISSPISSLRPSLLSSPPNIIHIQYEKSEHALNRNEKVHVGYFLDKDVNYEQITVSFRNPGFTAAQKQKDEKKKSSFSIVLEYGFPLFMGFIFVTAWLSAVAEFSPFSSKKRKLKKLAQFYFDESNVFSKLHRYSEALEFLEKGMDIYPNSTSRYFAVKARYLDLLGRNIEAIEYSTKAIEKGDDLGYAYYVRAAAHWNLGSQEQAESDLQEVFRHSPKSARGYILRAEIRLKQNKPDSAIDAANQALKLVPKEIDPYLIKAKASISLDQKDRAYNCLREALFKCENPSLLKQELENDNEFDTLKTIPGYIDLLK